MCGNKFLDDCKSVVVNDINKRSEAKITTDQVFVVWACKTLQNNKALLSATVKDAPYYEFTHNGDKKETYVDVYQKEKNFVIPVVD